MYEATAILIYIFSSFKAKTTNAAQQRKTTWKQKLQPSIKYAPDSTIQNEPVTQQSRSIMDLFTSSKRSSKDEGKTTDFLSGSVILNVTCYACMCMVFSNWSVELQLPVMLHVL